MPDYDPGWVIDQSVPIWIPDEDTGGVRASYWRDEFTTPEYPVASPRTCEPGPGSIELFEIDGGFWQIDCNGKLNVHEASAPAWNKVYLYTENSITRQNGVLYKIDSFCGGVTCRAINCFNPIKTGDVTSIEGAAPYRSVVEIIKIKNDGAIDGRKIGDLPSSEAATLAIMLRDVGNLILVKSETSYPVWTLLWSEPEGSASDLYPSYTVFQQKGWVDNFEVSLVDPISPLVYDDFNRPNQNGLGRSCGGGEWTTIGVWSIFNNRAIGSATAAASAVLDVAVTDYVIECISQAPAGEQGLLVRYIDAANHVKVFYRISDNTFGIDEVGGAGSATINPATPIAADTDYHIEAVVEGNLVTAYLNGAERIQATLDTQLTGTKVGMDKDATQNVQFDDFYVWPRTLETL